jgi:Ca2+-binding RTX toxin-like protein
LRQFGLSTIALLAFALIALASGPSGVSAQEAITCNLLTPTIVASEAGTINGTNGDDVIVGTAGDDIINAGGGNDTICGEGGNDLIHAGEGDDQMWGEAFRDDILIGAPGTDDLNGGSGDDLLVDPVGSGQTLHGGSGNDRVFGFGTLNGGSGDDNVRVLGIQTSPSTLNGGAGDDSCTFTSKEDALVSCEILP